MTPTQRHLKSGGLLILAIIVVSSVLMTYSERAEEAKLATQKTKSEKRVFSRLGRGLDPQIYAQFDFRPGEIWVLKPGRFFQDFGIPENSVLVQGNEIKLDTDESLGRCIMSYYKSGKLTLMWRHGSQLSEKTLTKEETSFYTVPVGHSFEIEER